MTNGVRFVPPPEDPQHEEFRQFITEQIIAAFELPEWQARLIRETSRIERVRTYNWNLGNRVLDFHYPNSDAHRVAAIADEELQAWDEFLASVKASVPRQRNIRSAQES